MLLNRINSLTTQPQKPRATPCAEEKTMSELNQIPASRKGKGGPRTEAGKQAASRNSTKHGLHAKTIDAFAPADREDFEALHREYATHFNPKDLIENELVQQLAF